MGMIADNVADIRRRMDEASASAGRPRVLLVAAAKTASAEAVREAIAAGVDAVGENRVQELLEKEWQGAYEGAPLHFIGRLQKNKVSKVVGRVALIHSVDSPALAQAIENQAARLQIVQPVLLEVNIGDESTKTGFTSDSLEEVFTVIQTLPHIRIRGLMCIPPPSLAAGEIHYFERMRQLSVDIGRKNMDNVDMSVLSMGMSEDFEEAIRAGATMVRVGSALFGKRVSPNRGI